MVDRYKKQALLYNVLDLMHTPGINLAMVGITCQVGSYDRPTSSPSHRLSATESSDSTPGISTRRLLGRDGPWARPDVP